MDRFSKETLEVMPPKKMLELAIKRQLILTNAFGYKLLNQKLDGNAAQNESKLRELGESVYLDGDLGHNFDMFARKKDLETIARDRSTLREFLLLAHISPQSSPNQFGHGDLIRAHVHYPNEHEFEDELMWLVGPIELLFYGYKPCSSIRPLSYENPLGKILFGSTIAEQNTLAGPIHFTTPEGEARLIRALLVEKNSDIFPKHWFSMYQ